MVASATGQAVSRMPVSVALRPSTVWKKKGRPTKASPCAVKVQVEAASDREKIGRLKMSTGIMGWTSRVWRQTRLVHPMMPVDIFKRPIFSLSLAASTCTFTAQGLAFVGLPFFFHTVLGRSATDTGILLTAWPVALATIAPIAGRLADRYHAGILGAIGLSSMTTGLILTALLPADPSAANVMWRLVLCGAGFGMFTSPNNRLMMNAVPRERSGSAGGIIATSRTLGQTMGAALVALMFGLFDFSAGGESASAAAHAALWLGVAFAGTALVVGSLRMKMQR